MSSYEHKQVRKSFVLPNESYKWDFVLNELAAEADVEQAGAPKQRSRTQI